MPNINCLVLNCVSLNQQQLLSHAESTRHHCSAGSGGHRGPHSKDESPWRMSQYLILNSSKQHRQPSQEITTPYVCSLYLGRISHCVNTFWSSLTSLLLVLFLVVVVVVVMSWNSISCRLWGPGLESPASISLTCPSKHVYPQINLTRLQRTKLFSVNFTVVSEQSPRIFIGIQNTRTWKIKIYNVWQLFKIGDKNEKNKFI